MKLTHKDEAILLGVIYVAIQFAQVVLWLYTLQQLTSMTGGI